MSAFAKRMLVGFATLFALVALLVAFQVELFAEKNSQSVYDVSSVSEPPTNLIIEAAEQNMDVRIVEVAELLDDDWLHSNRHQWGCCYKNSNCLRCGMSETEYDEQCLKAWGELNPGPESMKLCRNFNGELLRDFFDLAWGSLIHPYANIFVSTMVCCFVITVVCKARSKSSRRISTATLGLALGASLFIVGFLLGPFFACPTVELLRTRLWLQEKFPVLSSNSGYY